MQSVGGVTVTNANARNFLSESCIQTNIYAPGVLQGNNNSYSTLSGYLVAALGLSVGHAAAGAPTARAGLHAGTASTCAARFAAAASACPRGARLDQRADGGPGRGGAVRIL